MPSFYSFVLILSIFIFSIMAIIIAGKSFASEYSDMVKITPVGIKMPLNRFLLVRKDSAYGALKFKKFWTGKTENDFFAKYESYYQPNKTGNFLDKDAEFSEGELSFPKPRGIGRFAFSFGNKDIRFGSFVLFWYGEGSVYFYGSHQPEGDYGIELAPTKWTNISEVNVFDNRLKWYRYDPNRPNVIINIDDIWSDVTN